MDNDTMGRAAKFAAWFKQHSPALAQLALEMQAAAPEGPRRVHELFEELDAQIGPRLAAVSSGLTFEIGPGSQGRPALIISAGGVNEFAGAVKELVALLQDPIGWEVIAFKPARSLAGSAPLTITLQGRDYRIAAEDVQCSLQRGVTQLHLTLHFEGYVEEEQQTFAQIGFHFLDFALGEYEVLSGIGEIAFGPLPPGGQADCTLPELRKRYEAVREQTRSRYSELRRADPRERLASCVEILRNRIAELEQRASDQLLIELTLWYPETGFPQTVLPLLEQQLSGFEFDSRRKSTLLGEGIQVLAVGPLSGKQIGPWLEQRIGPCLMAGGVLAAIAEQTLPDPLMVQFAAKSFLDRGEPAEAISLLRLLAPRYGGEDGAVMLSLLAVAHHKLEQYAECSDAYDRVLLLSADPAVCGEAYTNRGSALQRLGKLDQALADFLRALELDPERFTRQYNVGQAYAQLGQAERACQHIAKAIDLNPQILAHAQSDRDLDGIRGTVEFAAMIARAQN